MSDLSRRKRTSWTEKQFKEAAVLLRKVGYKANVRNKQARGAIRRTYEKHAPFFAYAELNEKGSTRRASDKRQYNFKFQKLTKKEMKLAKRHGVFSSEQFTPKGAFVEKPVNVSAKKYKVKVTEEGVELSGGKRKDLIVRVDGLILAANPKKAYKEAVEKYRFKSAVLMVNGFNAKNTMPFEPSILFHYFANELFPDWMERNEKYYEDEDEAAEKFTDIFHLRLISPKQRKRK